MRHISLKRIWVGIFATVLLLMGSLSASAQYYLNVYEKSGSNSKYAISNLDSVSIVKYDVANVLRLTINYSRLNLETGESSQLSVRGFASNGTEIPLTGVTWNSSNTAVATVDTKGVIKTYKSGNATITASIGPIYVTCSLTVVDHTYTMADLSRIVINKNSVNIETGDSTKLAARGYASNGIEITLKNILWKSSNPAVATIDENGMVKTHKSGNATISVSFGLITSSCYITVVDHTYTTADVVRIGIDKKEVNIITGDRVALSVKGYAKNGVEVPLSDVVWKSDKAEIATVDASGFVRTYKQGTAHIIALQGSYKDTCTVTVSNLYADAGLYLGVMGFNSELYTQPISILNKSTKPHFNSFIKGFKSENQTILYYAVDQAIDALHSVVVPENLSTVAIVTFSDGLDEGSRKKRNLNSTEYVKYLSNKIATDSVGGLPITAYTIGLLGTLQQEEVEEFHAVLKKLSSSDSLAMEVDSIQELTTTFEKIANNLTNMTNYQTMTLPIPRTDDYDTIRFTLDIGLKVDPVTTRRKPVLPATASKIYIEGVYLEEQITEDSIRFYLMDLNYCGIDSLPYTMVEGFENEKGDVEFVFNKVLPKDNSKPTILEWKKRKSYSSWLWNDEFDPDESPDIVIDKSSAIIMLVLDCSSSLGNEKNSNSDFVKMQDQAISFVNMLYSSYNDTSIGGNVVNNAGYEYVDLGLSVLWATYNVGATKPEEYGNYYAWGETETKSNYNWTSYKFRTSGDSYSNVKLNKYVTSSTYGTVDNKTKLELTDDVAHEVWGGDWRIPTQAELAELLNSNNCTWTWTTQNGVKGYKVTSKITGYTDKSIFIPAAGYYNTSSRYDAGTYVYLWSSSLYSGNVAYYTYCNSSSRYANGTGKYRNYGFSIRPVISKPVEYEYVDLGLSVKWATFNVGASKPEEYGNYYAWGETETKSTYNWSTYKWCNGSSTTLTKYNNSSSYGTVDNKTTLDASDDVAHVKWGGNWRMPTKAEYDELLNSNNCTWTWTTQNGVNGYRVTSKKTGYTNKSIFLPAAGWYNSSGYNTEKCVYWSKSLSIPQGAYLIFGNTWESNASNRNVGCSVRPVCP